ncbi:MAG: hypothetical protein IKH56_02475 [Oscillospiraceae bacterium]|nr:hypothetical protein [Oscillospiraceae bacterium]
MKYLAICLCAISLCLSVLCVVTWNKRRFPQRKQEISLPFVYAGIGVLFVIFCGFMVVAEYAEQGKNAYLFMLFQPIGWFLQLVYMNLWVQYDSAGLIQSNLFGITRRRSFTEITRIYRGSYQRGSYEKRGYEVVVHCGKWHFSISPSQIGYREFLIILSRNVPREKWKRVDYSKTDPYRHHIPNGRLEFVSTILLPVIFIGTMVFLIIKGGRWGEDRSELPLILCLLGGLTLLSLGWMVLRLAVLRHPKRYSQRLQRLIGRSLGFGGMIGYPSDPVTDSMFPESEVQDTQND